MDGLETPFLVAVLNPLGCSLLPLFQSIPFWVGAWMAAGGQLSRSILIVSTHLIHREHTTDECWASNWQESRLYSAKNPLDPVYTR
jgi:hypothetical protein